ncbi:MAG: hypothetical protein GYB68_17590 [Chloroflexi bacterium]|nr:hypothetical protein [Chloroflexota bacterium]
MQELTRVSEYTIVDQDAVVAGKAMLGLIKCLNHENIQPVLAAHNLETIDPTEWYPMQTWMSVLRDIDEQSSGMLDLVSVGMAMMDQINWPPEFYQKDFMHILLHMNDAYQMNHRGDVGGYLSEVVDDHYVIVDVNVPYPDNLVYGAYYAKCRRFLPEGSSFDLRFDEDQPIRSQGGVVTLLHVRWS